VTRYLGGLITADETQVIPADNYEGTSAPGVWTLAEAEMLIKQSKWPTAGNTITRAFWFGRTTVNVFYSDITTLGNTTDWGYSMRTDRANYNTGTASSATRAVQCGYEYDPSQARSSNIEQLNLSSAGAGTNFGDLSVSGAQRNMGCGNATRGIFTQGYSYPFAYSNVIEYVTIASAGDGTDFGDLTVARAVGSACASPTRGVFNSGMGSSTYFDTIDYVTIASAGNATDFGNLDTGKNGTSSCSSSTRGIIAGGDPSQSNTIQYITIASAGNTTDFGDLTSGVRYGGAGCSETRGLFAGEFTGGATNMDYITIASAGNASDFGDLTNAETNGVSCASTSHGGLQ
tara:strand:+ start:763 stop:1797 length:1035 start_codon:yes stop_codon:yes gene_type:complete